MILIVEDILKRMQKLAQPELRSKFKLRGVKNVQFGLPDKALSDLSKEMGPQPMLVLESLWKTGYYECRWLALLALETRDITRELVERWGAELGDRAQAQCLAEKVLSFQFVSRRLKDWLESGAESLNWLAEEWLWAKLRLSETSREATFELQKLTPKIQELLASSSRHILLQRLEKLLST